MTTRVACSRLFALCFCSSILYSCIPLKTSQNDVAPTVALPIEEAQPSLVQLYFTEPESPASLHFESGPDEYLVAAIDSAHLTVDVAIYNLNLWSIRNALLDAHARGVIVRVVAESDNLDGEEFQELINAGIPVLGDRRESLMHNKFLVIDRTEVWTGSMNFTLTGAYEDNNNLIYVYSPLIAQDYLVEFNEMFEQDLFGNDTLSLTPHPRVQLGDSTVEVYFSPDDNVQSHFMELLESASESIYFLAYMFTSDELSDAIRARARAGVMIKGVMDGEQGVYSTGTELDNFLMDGLDVRLDGGEGLMHHKVIIIDNEIVISGSYNFTHSAEERNDENVMIMSNPDIAAAFMEEFWRIYNQSLQP